MLYAGIPTIILISAFYFYPKNAWKPFYNLCVCMSAVGFLVTVAAFFTFDTPSVLPLPYVFDDFYIVTNRLTLYMLMCVYGVLFCGILFFKHQIFFQIHHFEKMIILWLYTVFIIFSISAQNILQIVFAWAGCALCIFATSVYKDEKQGADMLPLQAFFAYIWPLVLFCVVFVMNVHDTMFGAIVFTLAICAMLGIFPCNGWVERFFAQGKLYAVLMCTLQIVLVVKFIHIYMGNIPTGFSFKQTPFLSMIAVTTMLVGGMVVYNQIDIFKRLAYIFGVFGSLGLLAFSVLPLPYTMVLLLYYMWIYVSIAGILCVIHFVLSGERNIHHMGGISQHTPILFVLYFVVMLGVGYVPIHSISAIMGKAVYVVDMPYTVYYILPIGGIFLLGHFLFCYGFGHLGVLLFIEENNTHEMVSAYLKKPSETINIFMAFLLILVCGIIFGVISNNMILPIYQKQWTYGNVLYLVVVTVGILGFVIGLFTKNKDFQISPFYSRNLYLYILYVKAIHGILYVLNRPSIGNNTADGNKVLDGGTMDTHKKLSRFKDIFMDETKFPYGMGYGPFIVCSVILLLFLIGYGM